MKFLYCSDLHGKLKNPVSRLDNYAESWLQKIKEIQQIAIDNRCRCIIVNGDIFDSPYISNILIDDFLDIIENQKTDNQVLWLVVPGNHDCIGANWELSKSSALAHIFRRSTLVQKLDTIETSDVLIQGQEYYYGIENNLKEKGLVTNSKAKVKIIVPHAFISIKPFFKEVWHILAKDLITNYDMILCGHFHSEFDETVNKTRFINLNAIGRTAINEQHQPQVAIIDTNTLEVQKIPLNSAKTINAIFDLSKYQELKENEKSIEDFIASLNSATWQASDLYSQIELIGKEQNVEPEVIKYIKNKIKEVQNV